MGTPGCLRTEHISRPHFLSTADNFKIIMLTYFTLDAIIYIKISTNKGYRIFCVQYLFSDTVAIITITGNMTASLNYRIRKQNSAAVLSHMTSCGLLNFSLVSQGRHNYFNFYLSYYL